MRFEACEPVLLRILTNESVTHIQLMACVVTTNLVTLFQPTQMMNYWENLIEKQLTQVSDHSMTGSYLKLGG